MDRGVVQMSWRSPYQNAPPYNPPVDLSHSSLIHPTTFGSREILLSIFDMPAPEVHHLFNNPIADHSFSADHGLLAVAKDTNVELYGKSAQGFTLKDELTGHDKTVTGVDIAPRSGRIVTCSQGTSPSSPESSPCLIEYQIEMPMSGNLRHLDGSQPWFFFV